MTVADMARNIAEQNALHAKKDGVRQTQSGDWKLTLTIAAGDLPTSVMQAAPGTRYVVALVEVGDDEAPVPQQINAHPSKAEKRRWSELPRSARAAMLCDDERFKTWVLEHNDLTDWGDELMGDEAEAVRILCNVVSRREFDTDPEAGARWDAMEARYMEETGLIARDR